MLKTSGFALGFQHFPRDLANVNEWKIMFDPSITESFPNDFDLSLVTLQWCQTIKVRTEPAGNAIPALISPG